MTTASISHQQTESAVTREPSVIESMAPLALILAVFYFLIIRPQQKKMKEHQDTVASLKSGDRVLIGSGIIGMIINPDSAPSEATLEISQGVVINIRKDMVTEVFPASEKQTKKVEQKKPSKEKTKTAEKTKKK
jgi:preprotein translocase subunit YajC